MSNLVPVESNLINAVIEQLDFHRDNLDSDEDKAYIRELIGDLESANSSKNISSYRILHKTEMRMIEKHIDLGELFGDVDVMQQLNG